MFGLKGKAVPNEAGRDVPERAESGVVLMEVELVGLKTDEEDAARSAYCGGRPKPMPAAPSFMKRSLRLMTPPAGSTGWTSSRVHRGSDGRYPPS